MLSQLLVYQNLVKKNASNNILITWILGRDILPSIDGQQSFNTDNGVFLFNNNGCLWNSEGGSDWAKGKKQNYKGVLGKKKLGFLWAGISVLASGILGWN